MEHVSTVTQMEEQMQLTIPAQVFAASSGYAALLALLERKYPTIKPDHTWAEVAGGVMIALVPVAVAARRSLQTNGNGISWQAYEGAIWRSFIAAGAPIILWQLGESVMRHVELMQYTTRQQQRSATYGSATTDPPAGNTVASGGVAPTR